MDDAWLRSPQAAYIGDWLTAEVPPMIDDLFGYFALQIGLRQWDFLRSNRMSTRLHLASAASDALFACHCAADYNSNPDYNHNHNFNSNSDSCSYSNSNSNTNYNSSSDSTNISGQYVNVVADPLHLPFVDNSIDLVVLPHVLEYSTHPHQVLREIERVLIAEGHLVICGFNPYSLWGVSQRCTKYPWSGQFISVPRLRDWLKLLGLELDRGVFGRYAPPFNSEQAFGRCRILEKMGDRWWGFAGSVYILRAVKHRFGMNWVGPVSAQRLKPKIALPCPVQSRQ